MLWFWVVVQFGEDPSLSFGMTDSPGVISSGSEKSFSGQKQTMILIELVWFHLTLERAVCRASHDGDEFSGRKIVHANGVI
jgi:hypothetical protein